MFDVKTMNLGEELNKAKNLPGQERAQNLKYLIEYTKKNYGQEGADRVIALLTKYGIKLPDVTKLDDLGWIPSDYTAQYMLTMAKVFDWQNEDVITLGKNLFSFSRIMKLFIKTFISVSVTLKRLVTTWRAHYNWGDVKAIEVNTAEKYAIYQISNFKKHPVTCLYLMGVIAGMAVLATGKEARVTERKCVFRGDNAHEFLVSWK